MIPTRSCSDLDTEINSLLNDGYRLDMIKPADAPRVALLSKHDDQVRLTANPKSEIQNAKMARGRAGMEYRDLIPDRLGGRVIASHIRITQGGEVPDYVHYHNVRFQMIYCKAGWVSVVYEDQGKPFVLSPGDCVLQPPGIRHRVLESSAGAEVIEISSPAEHETWVDHDLRLPNDARMTDRAWKGQRFVRSIAADATWYTEGCADFRETGIEKASGGLAKVRIARLPADGTFHCAETGETRFMFVLKGEVELSGVEGMHQLGDGDSILLPASRRVDLTALSETEILDVELCGF